MAIIETMKQALEVLENKLLEHHEARRLAITALSQAIEQVSKVEPVAWIRTHPDGLYANELLCEWQIEQVRRDSGVWKPLFTHPAPAVPEVDCAICTNRGGIYGLSQESNCEHCLWKARWNKKNLYAAPTVLDIQEPHPDINKCPNCGGPADNGHDRCYPPNPYYCTKCNHTQEVK